MSWLLFPGGGDYILKCGIKPVNLLCEYLIDPIGIDTLRPRFSWKTVSGMRGQFQTAYRILAASTQKLLNENTGDKWDSGKVRSNRTMHVAYEGKELVSGEKCYWMVCCWDKDDNRSEFSETSSFEMGLLDGKDWTGVWIGIDNEISAPLFRKSFEIEGSIEKATAYICGLGYYELYINGIKAGDHVLDPNWTDFDERNIEGLLYPFTDKTSKRVLYVTYDVTGMLQPGRNAVGVILGNGWYNQKERTVEGRMRYGNPKLLLQLGIQLTGGKQLRIASDGSWKYCSSPITFNNIFYGEKYDARLEKCGWKLAGFDDSYWEQAKLVKGPAGMLKSQMSPPDKIMGTIEPKKISSTLKGAYVYDIGQNFSGWVRLKVRGAKGTMITIKYAEELDLEGMLDFTSTGGDEQIQCDTYTLKGVGIEIYEPRFAWHGFRYVELSGSPSLPSYVEIEGIVVHASVERSGTFECSNPLFNQIQQNYIWTQLSNLHGGVPSDCPHRERLGYTGDGQITAEAAIYNFNMMQFYSKWVDDISDAQNKETGFVPHTAPFNGGGGGPAWGCALIIVPWLVYVYYGDVQILEKHYNAMQKWVEYLSSCADGCGIIVREEPGSWCLGEWCTPGGAGNIKLPAELVNTFYYSFCCSLMQKISKVLEKSEEEKNYRRMAEIINSAFNSKFLEQGGSSYSIGCQGADIFPLALGIVPEGCEALVLDHLVDNLIIKNDGHLDTGFIGTKFLYDVMEKYGGNGVVYSLLDNTTYPGYGHMIAKGATTLWETWEGEGSRNHPLFGTISAWFFKSLAGIQVHPDGAGFVKIIIKPYISEKLTYVKAVAKTMTGAVGVFWERDGVSFRLDINIPANTSAEVYIPKTGPACSQILESNTVLWDEGKVLTGKVEGIIDFNDEGEYCKVRIMSGEYCFKWGEYLWEK